MMVKIGDTYFAEGAIEAMVPRQSMDLCPGFNGNYIPVCDVHLANGSVVTAKATEDEIAAAVALLGLLAPPEEPETDLEPEELEELAALFGAGFRWAARDRDGKVFAYKDKPTKGRSCWQSDEHQRLHHDFDGIAFDDHAPLDLTKLFTGVPG